MIPPSACTTLMKLSKFSSTKCWIGIPKSCSIALMSWSGPWYSPASILLAPPERALGTKRSRGIDRIDSELFAGLRCRIITTSLLTPLTPWEHSP